MLVEHWDSITRAIACVEKIASKEILTHLEATDIQMRQRMKMHRSPHPRTLVVTLAPNSLSESSQVRDEAARAIKRIYMALRIPRVVTGQSRWGIWREEARWVSKSLSSKGQRLFFPVLMTAFLGNHTEWIQFLGPDWHKRRRFLQHKLKKENEPIIPNRTVIISADKMTSRRLIFVLSSFLPRQQGSEYSQISPPEASVQLLSGPQSPSLPSAMNRDRPDSSRKHSHFRHASGKGRFTHHFSASVPFTDISAVATQASGNANNSNSTTKPLERSTSSTLDELWQPSYHSNPLRNTASATVAYAAPEASIPVAHFSHESKRYSSGARYSSSGNGGSGSGTGGGYGGGGSSGEIDDESSSSMASENLMRNLRSSTDLPARPSGRSPQDTSSAATASTSTAAFAKKSSQPRHSRWDSILPGFWSSGSASSNGNNKSHQASLTTATTTATETTTKKLVVSTSALKSDARRGENSQRPVTFDTVRGKHGEDVNQQSQEQYGDDRAGELTTLAGAGDGKGRRAEVQARESQDGTSPESITSPIKISGCCDGVVDVELPLPGFVSLSPSTEAQMIPSYQKIRPSPASPDNCGSFQSNTSAPLHTPIWKEYDGLNINVAGWLKRFHEDFLLQAVRPYEELENDIRRTMSAEPTPANIVAMMSDHDHANDGDDGGESIGVWYDVCVTLIADVKACSVKQLRLQRRMVRKVKKKQKERNNSCYSANSSHHPPLPTQLSAQPTPPMELEQAVTEIEEQFIEESVVEVDDVFIEAVDRVLARNVPPTTSASTSTTATAAATPGNRVSKGRSASGQSLTLFGGTGGSGNINRRRSIQLRLDENHASDRTDGDNMSITEVPRAECSRLVLGALEEVVRSVTAERYSEDEHGVDDVLLNATSTPTVAATATTATTTPYKSLSRKPTNQENTLREGIRKWLSEVEETC
ncbi:hypothetical protein KEM54_003893 [Ascosphaera aggregata]|nr:hypothetical protein KEM54_003893 [Ascosphaera aggregata]